MLYLRILYYRLNNNLLIYKLPNVYGWSIYPTLRYEWPTSKRVTCCVMCSEYTFMITGKCTVINFILYHTMCCCVLHLLVPYVHTDDGNPVVYQTYITILCYSEANVT